MPYGEGNPQVGDGFARIANEILEALAHTDLTGSESRCIFFLWRKTYGWADKTGHAKKEDAIAYSQWVEGTGLDRRCLIRILDGLVQRKIFVKHQVSRPGKNTLTTWSFQKKYLEWVGFHEAKLVTFQPPLSAQLVSSEPLLTTQPVTPKPLVKHEVVTSGAESSGAGATGSSGAGATHNIHIKDNTIDIITPIIPSYINKETWDAFMEVRKKLKCPQTVKALKTIITKLGKLKADGNDPNEVLEESIMNGWKGVFALKNKAGGINGAHQGHTGTSTGPKQYHKVGEDLPLD